MTAGAWVFTNFDMLSGISFLPFEEHSYRQAPYQMCDKQSYHALVSQMPDEFDWGDALKEYEKEDTTTNQKDLACSSGQCEI